MKKNPFLLGAFLTTCAAIFAKDKMPDLRNLWEEQDINKRMALQDYMQTVIDKTLTAEYMKFFENVSETTKNPVLLFYDQTLDRIIQQIANEKPAPGTVSIWYLYNMGFIIKTPTVCFGVDINHHRGLKLEPYLDFLVITHNHNDHYTIPLMHAMTANKKMVISNFFPNPGYTKAASKTHEIKGVTIHCGESDHNRFLKKFTMPMEIVCPTGNRKFVFFTSGDTCHHSFLERKSDKIDLYAVHPYNGMIALEAAKKIDADLTFIVHLHEMTHEYNKWRWKYADGRRVLNDFQKQNRKAYIPVWGEKFVWDGTKVLVIQK